MFEAMQGKAEKQQQTVVATTTQAGSFVFSQTSMKMPKTFDGRSKVGEDPQQKVSIFTSQLSAYPGQQRCLEAVESLTPIKVGQPSVDRMALEAEFGAELVDQAYRTLSILIKAILYKPLLLQIQALGSPSEGWKYFKTLYAPQSAAAKPRMTQTLHKFGMRDGEAPNEYCAKGGVLRSQLGTHGVIHTDNDVNQHFAQNLTPDYSVKKSILLAKEGLRRKVLEDVVLVR